jgi:hypothetical protein
LVEANTLYIELGGPWEHGYRGGLLSGEIFYNLNEAHIVIEQ